MVARDGTVLIVGPSPASEYRGGVGTHVRVLKSYSLFANARVFDPGSTDGRLGGDLLRMLRRIIDLRAVVREAGIRTVLVNASILNSSLAKLVLVLQALAPARGRSTVHVFFHGGRFAQTNGVILRFFTTAARYVFANVTSFHFLSLEQLEEFHRIFPNARAELYGNFAGTDSVVKRERKGARPPVRLLFVGLIVREKGVFELLEAVEEIQRRMPGAVTLRMVGEGPAEEQVRPKAAAIPGGAVTLCGHLSGPALDAEYAAADLFVLPSYSEGFPYVVIEAMRAGLPVIAAPTGALGSLIVPGSTGLLVRAGDAGALVGAITSLVADPGGIDRMSGCCQDYFRRHLSRAAGESFYSGLLSAAAGPEERGERHAGA